MLVLVLVLVLVETVVLVLGVVVVVVVVGLSVVLVEVGASELAVVPGCSLCVTVSVPPVTGACDSALEVGEPEVVDEVDVVLVASPPVSVTIA